MLSKTGFRHALLDPHVEKQRMRVCGRGVYVDAVALERALRERDIALDAAVGGLLPSRHR